MKSLVFVFTVLIASGQQAEKLLESARHKEVMGGDLKAAIADYRKIAEKFKQQPEVAAQALYRMGECQEKLGEAEARKSYERVVKEYASAGSYVSQARARLAAMGGGAEVATGPRTRLVWDKATDFWGRVTADGRFLSFVDWATGDLAIRDLRSGTSRRLTNYGGYEKSLGEVESTSISPDGKSIVFNWDTWAPGFKENGSYQLRFINADGTGERILRKAELGLYFEAQGWSADGKWVALYETRKVAGGWTSFKIVLLSPGTEEFRTIETSNSGHKHTIYFSPDSKWLAFLQPVIPGAKETNVFIIGTTSPGTREILVAENAELLGWTPSGDGLILRQTEGLRTRMLHLPIAEGRNSGVARDLHVPVGEIARPLGISNSGDLFYGTVNRHTEALVSKIDVQKGLSTESFLSTPVSGVGWGNNWGNLRFSPDGKSLASANSSRSIRVKSLGGNSERILAVQAELLRFEWMPDGSALIASVFAPGGSHELYRIDVVNGANTLLCKIKEGRVFTPSADGKSVFHLTGSGLQVVDLASGNTQTLVDRDMENQGPMNIKRSKDGKSILLVTFAQLTIFEVGTGEVREIYKRDVFAGGLVWAADWSADDKHVFALARISSVGASVDRELRIYPRSGGEPFRQKLEGTYRDFAISSDGVNAALTKEDSHSQVWVLENFLPSKK